MNVPLTKSLSTSTMNMWRPQSAKLPKSALVNGHNSTLKRGQHSALRLPKLAASEGVAGDQKQEEQYIEKLHNHIQFLNQEILKTKDKQDSYKSGLMGMMNRDQKPFIDQDIQSEIKFKEMRQKLGARINELENEKLRLENEIISLSGRKEQYSAWLGERDKYHEELSKTQKDLFAKQRAEFDKLEKKRQDLEQEIAQSKVGLAQKTKELKNKLKQRTESLYHKEVDENYHQMSMVLRDKDWKDKDKQFKDLNVAIGKLKSDEDQDPRYQELHKRKLDLISEIEKQMEERDLVQYETKQVEALTRLAEQEKIDINEQNRLLALQLDKQSDMYQQMVKNNEARIESKVQQSRSEALQKKQIELDRAKKEARELEQRLGERRNAHTTQHLDLTSRLFEFQELKDSNDKKEKRLADVLLQINSIKEEYELNQGEHKREEEERNRLQKFIAEQTELYLKSKDKHQYLSKKVLHFHDNVKLEEVMNGVKIDELFSTSYQNTQFNSALNGLREHWEQMMQYAQKR